MDDSSQLTDHLETTVTAGPASLKIKYEVVSDGVHKNSRIYKPGEIVELDELTAKNFLREGNIKEIGS